MDQHGEAQIELAHRERRRAFKLLKALRFEEAITAHNEAITHLQKTQLASSDPVVRESLLLQIAFHRRQKQLVQYKRELNQQNQRKRQSSNSFSRTIVDAMGEKEMDILGGVHAIETSAEESSEDLQKGFSFFHSMVHRNEELLLHLEKMCFGETGCANSNETITETQDRRQVIEELRANNCELRRVFSKVIEINSKLQQQNKQLESEIATLRLKLRSLEGPSITGTESNMDQSLPDLAPLEIPNFEKFSTTSTSLFS